MDLTPPPVDHLVVILSDLELGGGGPNDDFPHDEWFAELLERYASSPDPVDLVFNGDTLDFLKIPTPSAPAHHVTEADALAELEVILGAHGRIIEALGRFLRAPARRCIHFVTGNHDLELLFPAVQRRIREAIGLDAEDPRVCFPGFELRLGELHIEHGSQVDPLFRVDPSAPFVEHGGQTILAQPWGSVALLSAALPLEPELAFLDRVKPRELMFAALPEARDLLLGRMKRYWTGPFVRDAIEGRDPLRSVSWGLFREVLNRFLRADSSVGGDSGHYMQLLQKPDGPRAVFLGHVHTPSRRDWADRRLIVGGALRDEFTIDPSGRLLGQLPKVWLEARMAGEKLVTTRFVEEFGPPPPRDLPEEITTLRPHLQELLRAEQLPLAG